MARRRERLQRALVLYVPLVFSFFCSSIQASPLPFTTSSSDDNATLPFLPRRALAQASSSSASSSSSSSRCRVLALPCVSSVYVQAGAGPCAGPSAFGRENTCCPIVRDFVDAGCACDGAFLAVASFGGWNGAKLAQAVRAILSTPCGKGLRDPSCNIACPMLPSGGIGGNTDREKGGNGGGGGGSGGGSDNSNGAGGGDANKQPQPSPAQPAGSRKRTRRRRGR